MVTRRPTLRRVFRRPAGRRPGEVPRRRQGPQDGRPLRVRAPAGFALPRALQEPCRGRPGLRSVAGGAHGVAEPPGRPIGSCLGPSDRPTGRPARGTSVECNPGAVCGVQSGEKGVSSTGTGPKDFDNRQDGRAGAGGLPGCGESQTPLTGRSGSDAVRAEDERDETSIGHVYVPHHALSEGDLETEVESTGDLLPWHSLEVLQPGVPDHRVPIDHQ
jgi:hypothetical protein